MKIFDELDLTNAPKGTVIGNHGVWIPTLGVKVPFQWGGIVTKYSRREDGYPRETIAHEIAILRALAAAGMAPPIGEVVFFQNIVSTYQGAWHCDPCGAYGYEIADARSCPPGRFSLEAMKRMPIEGSPGAWGDIGNPGNVVNGYLIDVRRSGWDMLRWQGPFEALPNGQEPLDALRARVHRECQFPAGEREVAYQDFWHGPHLLERGQRRVLERAKGLGFEPRPGESVLDIGTQSGGFLQYAWAKAGGQGRFVGVDSEGAYVSCARALARSRGENICFRQMNVLERRAEFIAWLREYFADRVDHLLLLSMEKHLGEGVMFDLIDDIGAIHTYIETNAVSTDSPRGTMKLWPEVAKRGGSRIGISRDRNMRLLYRIDR